MSTAEEIAAMAEYGDAIKRAYQGTGDLSNESAEFFLDVIEFVEETLDFHYNEHLSDGVERMMSVFNDVIGHGLDKIMEITPGEEGVLLAKSMEIPITFVNNYLADTVPLLTLYLKNLMKYGPILEDVNAEEPVFDMEVDISEYEEV
jgi:hypothetical protein